MNNLVRKILSNNQGSVLAMVVIIITILSTLGMAVISLGVVNLKSSLVEQKAKLSFYMAESGLEQAYGIILEEVKEAVKAGNDAVKEAIDFFIDEEINKYARGEETAYVTIENGNYKTNEEKIINDLEDGKWDSLFRQAYKQHFNKVRVAFIKKLENDELYCTPFGNDGGNGDFLPKIIVCDAPDPFFKNIFDDEEKTTTLTLSSQYPLEEGQEVPQEVKMQFTISTPKEVLENYYVNVIKQTLKENPVWNRTLAAFGEIVINDTKEIINEDEHLIFDKLIVLGNVYSGERITLQSTKEYVDISNPVKIIGDVATPGNLEITGGSKGCSLTVDGRVYAKNLLIAPDKIEDNNRVKTENNSVTVKGHVYTEDDLEINGIKSNVKIEGKYFGFSDGSNSENHDQSSGIVINADDINDINEGSTLVIEGKDFGDGNEDEPALFINGVSYIKGVRDPYPTGESLSIKGNYRAYSYYLGRDSGYDYTYNTPLTLVNKRRDENGVWKDMTSVDKADYFWLVGDSDQPYNNPFPSPIWLNLGKNINLPDADNIIYTLGAYVNKGSVKERGQLDYKEVQEKADAYQEQFENSFLKTFTEYFKINDEINNKEDLLPDVDSEFVFFSRDKDVYLIGSKGNIGYIPGSAMVKDNITQPLRGIIITTENVYLRGELDFSGLIVSGGNIYVEDSHSKIIKFDKEYIRKVAGDLGEDNPFKEIDSWEQQIYEKNYVGVTESASINPYKQYVSIDSWEKLTN